MTTRRAQYDVKVKQTDLGERTLRFVASTGREDRDGDTIDPTGIKTHHFDKNPVFLPFHDYGTLPVGKVMDTHADGTQFLVDVRFPTVAELGYSEESDMPDAARMALAVYRWYKAGLLNAVSIGFQPVEDAVERKDGGGYHFHEVELLEVSAVPVPSNRDAVALMRGASADYGLLERWAKGVLDKEGDKVRQKEGQVLSARNREHVTEAMRHLAAMLTDQGEDPYAALDGMEEDKQVSPMVKTTTPFQDLPLTGRDREWDSDAAVERIRELTDSEEEPASGYKRFFMWHDEENAQNFGAYKLPYADVIDGEPRAVPRAITTIAGVLEGARGGVDVPDDEMPALREHVADYYAKMRDEFDDFDQLPPWEDTETEERSMSDAATKQLDEATRQEVDGLLSAMETRLGMIRDMLSSEQFDMGARQEIVQLLYKQKRAAKLIADCIGGSYGDEMEMRQSSGKSEAGEQDVDEQDVDEQDVDEEGGEDASDQQDTQDQDTKSPSTSDGSQGDEAGEAAGTPVIRFAN